MKPGFFQTVRLLLKTSRKRAIGRSVRQKQLLNHKTGDSNDALQTLGYIMMFLFMGGLHIAAAFTVKMIIEEAQAYTAEQHGKVIVSHYFNRLTTEFYQAEFDPERDDAREKIERRLEVEADRRQERLGGTEEEHLEFLRSSIGNKPPDAFTVKSEVTPGIKALSTSDPFAKLLGSFVIGWWLVMIVFQGEGVELDLQRRRHPMWEWLLTHPVHPGAVFLAEMISPFAANPVYITAPLFIGIVFGSVYGAGFGLLSIVLIGIPVSLAASSLGKALEICIMLRCPPRSRGAIIGIMGWLGYCALISFIFCISVLPRIVNGVGGLLYPAARVIPSPSLGWIIGARPDGSFSYLTGMAVCWAVSLIMIVCGVGISVWGTQKGLSGSTASTRPRLTGQRLQFGKDPLYRKELLWFIRDRSAIVQVILIPITIAGIQLFNLRNAMEHATGAWHTLAGAAVMFGTYFLWILGPRSLASEGNALWIAQTWPRGMEDLMKAKAKLWYWISSAIVLLALFLTAFKFPYDWWKLALIGLGWLAFGGSMAEKAVTLVSAPTSSGEPEPIPTSRRMAAALGMLTFGIGILTKQWQLVCMGIVYSWMTAAAMWQNFRARLPFLFDPWSEKVPPPPTVMHAMIAISAMIEIGAMATGIVMMAAGKENLAISQTISYAFIAALVMLVTTSMLSQRYLPSADIWSWRAHCQPGKIRFMGIMGYSLLIGAMLGFSAHGYIFILELFEPLAEIIQKSTDQLNSDPQLHILYGITAVGIAPFAEEFLFRGLLFRALDKEWGGWKALLGSSAFFAIYHPPMAWIPVGLMGLINAWIFKRTGRLAPCVLLHMVYNTVVLAW